MCINLKKAFLFISLSIFLSSCVPEGTELQKDWPMILYGGHTSSFDYYYAPVKKGCIILRSNDTLLGTIKFVPYINESSPYIQLLPIGKKDKKDIITIARQNINFIRLYPDTAKLRDVYVEYTNIDNKELLWSLYAQKNIIKIFRYQDIRNGINHTKMMFVTQNDTINMGADIFKTSNEHRIIYNRILKFLNKHYKQHFGKNYFKDEESMIDYMLDKEVLGKDK